MGNLKFVITVLFSSALVFNSSAIAQQDVQETIKKAIDAHGGKEALIKAQKFKRTSSGTIFFGQTQNFTDELIVSFPNKIKLNIKLDTKENLLMCLEGDMGWSIASGFPIDLSKEKIGELKEESYFLQVSNLVTLLDPGCKLTSLGESKLGNKPVQGIKASLSGGPEISLYFDKETNLLSKAERKGKQSGVEILKGIHYSDYQTFGANKFATRETHFLGGNKFVENKNIVYTILDRVEDSLFKKPGK
ncbi:MAG: hypothetical protein EBT92_07240 [Planctomycetes bacterium]|nr:hypothetical protein [Planctomycetota bacterium]NBY01361.1 hypothetical protein [Planctomycetota bacterium]